MAADIVVKNGRLVDGTGNPWRYADVGVKDGRVAWVRDREDCPGDACLGSRDAGAVTVIDACGKVVTPGFVDVHNHADFSVLDDPLSPYFVFQGVTALIVGNCGHGLVGGGADALRDYWYRQGLISKRQLQDTRQWDTLAEYRDLLRTQGGLALWSGALVGHGSVRMAVMGAANRPATSDELARMQAIVRQGMEDGAVGFSTGLDYIPSRFAPTAEIVELARIAAEYGGTYASHTRGTPDRKDMIAAVQEAIEVGEKAGIKVQISHISRGALAGSEMRMIEDARARGVDVACDAIPYSTFFALRSEHVLLGVRSGSANLFARSMDEIKGLLRDPESRKRLFADERIFRHYKPESVMFLHCADPGLEGRTPADVAGERGVDWKELLVDLVLDEDRPFTLCPKYEQSEDFAAIPEAQLKHPLALMGSDAGPVDPLDPKGWFSPQGSNSTFRYLKQGERYGVPFEERVRKLTSLACQRFGLNDRGLIQPGKVADLLVFDPAGLTEVVDWDDVYASPVGMSHVLVGGVPVVKDGRMTGSRPGGLLNAREMKAGRPEVVA